MNSNNIEHDGYILIRSALTREDLEFGLSCKDKNKEKYNYFTMKKFIDTKYLTALKNQLDFMEEPIYTKFRYSNNNNSTDASTFHSDVYNHTNSNTIPIYTCLCYFDKAQLEVIPGSHNRNNKTNSLDCYNKKLILEVNPGDILLFNANLHHRGINFNKQENRRLLQIFEVFPDKTAYNENKDKLIIVQTSKSLLMHYVVNPLSYHLSKYPIIIDNINYYHYQLMYNNLHYKIALMDLAPWEKENKYITYEPGKSIYIENLTNDENINVNVICNKSVKIIPPSNFYFFLLLFIIILIFSLTYLKTYKLKYTRKVIGKNSMFRGRFS
jgi:ectoine hydroxylase-related dioxygenase (phytanoyl-CoA dioxygenase family)